MGRWWSGLTLAALVLVAAGDGAEACLLGTCDAEAEAGAGSLDPEPGAEPALAAPESPWSRLPVAERQDLARPFARLVETGLYEKDPYGRFQAAVAQWRRRGSPEPFAAVYYDEFVASKAEEATLARRMLIAAYRLMKKTGDAWALVGTIYPQWAPYGGFHLVPADPARFRAELATRGCGPRNFAAHGAAWGARSRADGVGLHFVYRKNGQGDVGIHPDLYNVHMDVYNPTLTAGRTIRNIASALLSGPLGGAVAGADLVMAGSDTWDHTVHEHYFPRPASELNAALWERLRAYHGITVDDVP